MANTDFDAVLFDFDGVIVDSERLHCECWAETLKQFDISLDWDTYRQNMIGISDDAMIDYVLETSGSTVPAERIWREYPSKRELFRRRMETADVCPAATRSLLADLKDYKLAVVSSSGRLEVEPVLERLSLRRHLGALVCAEDVARLKPAPDPYRRAAELLGARWPLVVEDSAAGIESGRAAGFDVLHIPDPARTAELVHARLAAGRAT
jgi:beta-phosphoglucomutase